MCSSGSRERFGKFKPHTVGAIDALPDMADLPPREFLRLQRKLELISLRLMLISLGAPMDGQQQRQHHVQHQGLKTWC